MKVLRNMTALIDTINPVVSQEAILVPGELQTKDWRKSQPWYIDGRHNECELLQRSQVKIILKCECEKTNMRFNLKTFNLQKIRCPLKRPDGFEWTEDFDGLCIVGYIKFYFNFKFICDAGGAQTRSLREVYDFVEGQLEFFDNLQSEETHDKENIYFINILDGNTPTKHQDKFKYLIETDKYKSIKNNIFVGDMYTFKQWYTFKRLYTFRHKLIMRN